MIFNRSNIWTYWCGFSTAAIYLIFYFTNILCTYFPFSLQEAGCNKQNATICNKIFCRAPFVNWMNPKLGITCTTLYATTNIHHPIFIQQTTSIIQISSNNPLRTNFPPTSTIQIPSSKINKYDSIQHIYIYIYHEIQVSTIMLVGTSCTNLYSSKVRKTKKININYCYFPRNTTRGGWIVGVEINVTFCEN